MENCSLNPRKVHVKYFIGKVTGDSTFLNFNFVTSIFEEVWPMFQLATFMNSHCSEELTLHSSSDCDF